MDKERIKKNMNQVKRTWRTDRQTDIVVSIYRERYKGMELPELKSTLSAITNSPDGFNSRLEIAEEKISYTAIETIQTEPQSSSE